MKKTLIALALALAIAACLAATAVAQPLPPKDNTDSAPNFAAFRTMLRKAIADRDAAFFRSRAKDAHVTFGRPTTLEKMYKLDDPNDPFWGVAEKVVNLGGRWDKSRDMVVYPYVFADWPDNVDPFDHEAVTGKDVTVRKEAGQNGQALGTVSYEVVKLLERGEKWHKVKSSEGLVGYVHEDYLYSPVGYRMGLQLVKGRWTIVLFIAGD